MALSSDMPLPYSVDNSSLVYTNVPTTAAGYYSSVTPPHWMNGNALPTFDAFHQGEPSQLHNPAYAGEIPVAVIDMQIPRGGAHIEAEMNPQLNFYSEHSPSASPERQLPVFYDMAGMVHPEMAPGAVCPPYPTHKPAKSKYSIQNTLHIKLPCL